MSIIYVLIPLAVIIVAIAIAAFFWAVKSNQFEDLERQGYSILFDDDIEKEPGHSKTSEKNTFESDDSSNIANDIENQKASTKQNLSSSSPAKSSNDKPS